MLLTRHFIYFIDKNVVGLRTNTCVEHHTYTVTHMNQTREIPRENAVSKCVSVEPTTLVFMEYIKSGETAVSECVCVELTTLVFMEYIKSDVKMRCGLTFLSNN